MLPQQKPGILPRGVVYAIPFVMAWAKWCLVT